MAIYHCSLRIFSRANDHSAVAAAAYRAGAMLRDERTGITHRYHKRTTYNQARENTRAEAEIKRAKIPPEYRAEPYEREQPEAKASTQSQGNQAKQAWSKQEKSESETDKSTQDKTEKPKHPKMSAGFNKAAAEETPPPHDNPEIHPEDERDLDI